MRMRLAAAGLALAISLLFTSPASATPASPDPQLQQRHRFDIHVQPLNEGLRLLAMQSGVRILFSYDVAASIRGRRVEGFMSTEEALRRLLQGTELKYSRAGVGVLAMHYRQPASCAALSAAASAASPAIRDSTVAMRRGSADAACR
ncbi:TonB-dependent receptor [Sphingobium amiense]|uniref:TonB-dependent receptor n=1 Tax=Sphingobium amiense TaxID=135719 RepID=A0A494WAN8_9SPHN|nr:STN domain-containing protein [Sphingobium amiense]BBD97532.1 TonB-dependent receptor [Sphingobium amiense]